MNLKPEEEKFLSESKPCACCGHLLALHNFHCCTMCMVPECPCEWFDEPEGAELGEWELEKIAEFKKKLAMIKNSTGSEK